MYKCYRKATAQNLSNINNTNCLAFYIKIYQKPSGQTVVLNKALLNTRLTTFR